jgi:hypothetical protein
MKKIIVILASVIMTSIALAHLPPNWTREHAASDFEKADAIVVARVVGLNRSTVTNRPSWVDFHATFIVGKSIRGSLKPENNLTFLIGQDSIDDPVDETQPRYGLLLHGTQQSYNLEINGVYLLCLSKTEQGWEPRSGPYSVFRVHKESIEDKPSRLVVDPRDNRTEAIDHLTKQIKERSHMSLDDFLKTKMIKKEDAQPSPGGDSQPAGRGSRTPQE